MNRCLCPLSAHALLLSLIPVPFRNLTESHSERLCDMKLFLVVPDWVEFEVLEEAFDLGGVLSLVSDFFHVLEISSLDSEACLSELSWLHERLTSLFFSLLVKEVLGSKLVAHLSFFHELLFNSAVVIPLKLSLDSLDVSLNWSETSLLALLSVHSEFFNVLFIELRFTEIKLRPGSLARGANLLGMHWCRRGSLGDD